jgi:hypothetical protein
MTPYTAALTWRSYIRLAAVGYAHFIQEDNADVLQRWADTYKTGDIKQWAKKRISEILERASQLQPFFADDESVCLSVQNAARSSLEQLEQIGCLSGNVLDAGIMRIESGGSVAPHNKKHKDE